MTIRVKRIYDKPDVADGFRVLVDRLWPRGITKEAAKIDQWAKGVAPSTALRRWFHEDKTGRHAPFAERYKKELKASRATKDLKGVASRKPRLTLITAVKVIEQSHIPILVNALRS